ncbi:MAG: penicillin-insensitive murein endopeptidase [Deltaproteobacteria bacterium]|nr:penicillin-insensitive murein endopeptidase [Deltaproteobacteria bacterium]
MKRIIPLIPPGLPVLVLALAVFAAPALAANSDQAEPSPTVQNAAILAAADPNESSDDDQDANDGDGIVFDDEVEGDQTAPAFDPESIDLTGKDLSKLPCLSVGAASGGRLVNGVKMTSSPGLRVRVGHNNFGTPETIAALRYAVAKVKTQYPEAHDLLIGDISRPGGGRLKRHRSHQSGRDVDVSYYYKNGWQPTAFQEASASNLDVKKTWTFVEALMEDNKTEYIFIDNRIQKLLYNYVKYKLKAPPSYLETVFSYPNGSSRTALIRHARGHSNHMHVRFWSAIAVAAAREYHFKDSALARLQHRGRDVLQGQDYVDLERLERVDYGPAPKTQIVKEWRNVRETYRVRKGDTLSGIAKRNGVGTSKLVTWNRVNGKTILRPGQRLVLYKRKLVDVEVPLILPEDDAQAQTASYAPDGARTAKNGEERADWVTVDVGDNLWEIAKRTGTSVDMLCQLNGLTPNAVLRVGQQIKVRVWTEKAEAQPAADAADQAQSEAPKRFTYYVADGDSIYSIAARFGLKIGDLCRQNDLQPTDKLKEGRGLVIQLGTAPVEPDNENASADTAKKDLS